MLAVVAAEGVTAGNPLKVIVGPFVVVELKLDTERLIRAVPLDPRFATVWMGVMKEEEVQFAVELTSAVFATPVPIFRIVPLE